MQVAFELPAGDRTVIASEERIVCIDIGHEDIREFVRFSEEALPQLVDARTLDDIPEGDPLTEMARFYIRQGSLVIRQFADCFEAGRLDREEACALYTLLMQSERMLGMAIAGVSAEGQSCIGQAESEKQDCKSACPKKFCGCVWNAFLAKSNCFVKINVGKK